MDKRLRIYQTGSVVPQIVPAPMSRPWMDGTAKSYANRCLPLRVACGQGWQVRNDITFAAIWNGQDHPDAIKIITDHETPERYVTSLFGYGVLTFHNHFLVRTPPGVDLVISGPVNEQRDGIEALTGVIETDWMPMSFTMNWKFTRAFTPAYFIRGEAYLQMQVAPRGYGEDYEVTLRPHAEYPDKEAYRKWSDSRDQFHRQVRNGDTTAIKRGWQGDYNRGARRKTTRYAEVK